MPDRRLNPYAKVPTCSFPGSEGEATDRATRRGAASLRGVFLLSAELAFLSLLLAPSAPHRGPYSPFESFMARVTSDGWMIAAYLLVFASVATALFWATRTACRRVFYRCDSAE